MREMEVEETRDEASVVYGLRYDERMHFMYLFFDAVVDVCCYWLPTVVKRKGKKQVLWWRGRSEVERRHRQRRRHGEHRVQVRRPDLMRVWGTSPGLTAGTRY